MMHRRNSVIARDQCCDEGPVSTVMNINGRYPRSGQRLYRDKDAFIYVVKGSGMVGQSEQKTSLSAGNVMHLKRGEPFYLKGQFAVYVMSVS